MKIKNLFIATATTLGLGLGLGLFSTVASAAALGTAQTGNAAVDAGSSVIQAQYVQQRQRLRRGEFRDNQRIQRRGAQRLRGYRGYRSQRRGYRRHSNGYWYPGAAFLGAVIGGAIINNSRSSAASHYAWCEDRYRSYRRSDDTFQPYGGVSRQRCESPYN